MANSNANHSKGFRSILMKLEPFERDSKHSNANSNHSKGIRSILIQILTIRKKFEEAFEIGSKFEPFEKSKHWKQIRIIRKIQSIRKCHSKWIRSIEMQIRTIRKDYKHSNSNSKHSKTIRNSKHSKALKCKFEPFERDSKHSNANSNHSKGIRSIRKGFKAFK